MITFLPSNIASAKRLFSALKGIHIGYLLSGKSRSEKIFSSQHLSRINAESHLLCRIHQFQQQHASTNRRRHYGLTARSSISKHFCWLPKSETFQHRQKAVSVLLTTLSPYSTIKKTAMLFSPTSTLVIPHYASPTKMNPITLSPSETCW